MRRNIIGLLVLVIMLANAPAGATTCICIGIENTKACGSGGVGGVFLDVEKNVSQLKYYLSTETLRMIFLSAGKAYDSKTGWFCMK